MRILVVTPYPPQRDGIAQFAVQSVARLRGEGHDVEVLSNGPTAAHHWLDLSSARGVLALARRMRDYDRVILQYHPDIFLPENAGPERMAYTNLLVGAALRSHSDSWIVPHEPDWTCGGGRRWLGATQRFLWRSPSRVQLFTESDADRFASLFGLPRDRIEVVAHHADFVPRTTMQRAEARRSLGITDGAFVFLSIGFIQPHKGFDRAIRAFSGLPPGSELYIVGSVRVEDEEYASYLAELEAAGRSTPGTHLRIGYVSDEEFDRWLVASDAVVLPYRAIWTSSVLARAALFGCRVIATRVGSLEGQAEMLENVVFVDDDAGLAAAMLEATGSASAGEQRVVDESWGPLSGGDRAAVMDEIRRRAALERGSQEPFMWDAGQENGAGRTAESQQNALAPLEALPKLGMPEPGASGMLRRLVQVAVRRVTAWEIDPLVNHINRLHAAELLTAERISSEFSDGTGTTAAEHLRDVERKQEKH